MTRIAISIALLLALGACRSGKGAVDTDIRRDSMFSGVAVVEASRADTVVRMAGITLDSVVITVIRPDSTRVILTSRRLRAGGASATASTAGVRAVVKDSLSVASSTTKSTQPQSRSLRPVLWLLIVPALLLIAGRLRR